MLSDSEASPHGGRDPSGAGERALTCACARRGQGDMLTTLRKACQLFILYLTITEFYRNWRKFDAKRGTVQIA